MKHFVLLALLITSSSIIFCQSPATGTATAGKNTAQRFVPNGSYKQSCKNITVSLNCQASTVDKQWKYSVIDITDMAEVEVRNINGELKPTASYAPAKNFIPGGSFDLTSINIKVMLNAQCQKTDGSWIASKLDITHLPTTVEIENMDGVLAVKINQSSELPGNSKIKLWTKNGYVSADNNLGLNLVANREKANGWETFEVINLENNQCALKAWNGKYVSTGNADSKYKLVASSDQIGNEEKFTIRYGSKNDISIMSAAGKYVSAQLGSDFLLYADRATQAEWETFKMFAVTETNPYEAELKQQQAPPQPAANMANIRAIKFENKFTDGVLVNTGDYNWSYNLNLPDLNIKGASNARFPRVKETGRDNGSIYLFEPTQKLKITIDLVNKQVIQESGRNKYHYTIKDIMYN